MGRITVDFEIDIDILIVRPHKSATPYKMKHKDDLPYILLFNSLLFSCREQE
jgi:hypothetical protein